MIELHPCERLYGIPSEKAVVSICIPTYKRSGTLAAAIRSALNQDCSEVIEVIVTDNSDGVEALRVVQEFPPDRVTLWRNSKNMGSWVNWNQGLALSRGDWVTVLHDDDELAPSFLSIMLATVRSGTCSAGFCSAFVGTKAPTWEDVKPGRRREITSADLFAANITPFPGVLMSRSIVHQLGGFRRNHHPASDYDLWCRLSKIAPLYKNEAVLAFYRRSETQASANLGKILVKNLARIQLKLAAESSVPKFVVRLHVIVQMKAMNSYYARTYSGKVGLLDRNIERACVLVHMLLKPVVVFLY